MKDKTKYRILYAFNIIVPIIAGTFFYLLFRPDAVVTKAVYGLFDIENAAEVFTVPFINSFLCDILWAYSLTYAVNAVLNEKAVTTACICIMVETATEFLQLAGIFYGTFDVLDILFESASTLFALFTIKIIKGWNQNEKNN